MSNQTFDINNLRVASPCSVSWNSMTGDERARLCHSCKLHVYNISELTENEVEKLISNRESRLCIRLYKRVDGTVITKDCPVGIRAYRKRVVRFAGAVFATVLGLFSISFGQKDEEKNSWDASKSAVVKVDSKNDKGALAIVVTDSAGAIVSEAQLTLRHMDTNKKISTRSDKNGEYKFSSLPDGMYVLETKFDGFASSIYENIEIKKGFTTELTVVLNPLSETVTVGIYLEESAIDTTSSEIKTTITNQTLSKMPD